MYLLMFIILHYYNYISFACPSTVHKPWFTTWTQVAVVLFVGPIPSFSMLYTTLKQSGSLGTRLSSFVFYMKHMLAMNLWLVKSDTLATLGDLFECCIKHACLRHCELTYRGSAEIFDLET